MVGGFSQCASPNRRTDTEAEVPIFWSPDANSQLIRKVPDSGKYWGQKEKRLSEDEIAGWHHQCNGHDLGQTLGYGEGQGGLACCSPWGHKKLDTKYDWVTKQWQQFLIITEMSFIGRKDIGIVSSAFSLSPSELLKLYKYVPKDME